jgi:hypothetical protein
MSSAKGDTMSDDLPPREDPAFDAAPRPAERGLRLVSPLDDEAEETEGGDPVCWAHLVCDECGAITSEGHRAACSQA